MITVNELQNFLEDNERQILAMDRMNLLKINAIDEETGVNIPGISYICCVDWPVGVTPFSKYSTTNGTNLLGIYDKENKKLYYKRISSLILNDKLKSVVDEIGSINFKNLYRLVVKEVDKILQKEYKSLRVQKQIENYNYKNSDFKKSFIEQRIEAFFEKGVTVYGKNKDYELKLTAYDYSKLISDKKYAKDLAMRYLFNKPEYRDVTNFEVNIEDYIYRQAKLNFNRNINLNDDDKKLMSLFKGISEANNARTVKIEYQQGNKSTEITVNVDEIRRRYDHSDGYSFSEYVITTMKATDKFYKDFKDEEDNRLGHILLKGIKKVKYGRKVLFEEK